MMRKKHGVKEGFSILETIIYMALLSLLVSGLNIVIYVLISASAQIQNMNYIEQAGINTLDQLIYEIDFHQPVIIPSNSLSYDVTDHAIERSFLAPHVIQYKISFTIADTLFTLERVTYKSNPALDE